MAAMPLCKAAVSQYGQFAPFKVIEAVQAGFGLLRAQGKPIRLLGLVVGLPRDGEVNQLSLDFA